MAERTCICWCWPMQSDIDLCESTNKSDEKNEVGSIYYLHNGQRLTICRLKMQRERHMQRRRREWRENRTNGTTTRWWNELGVSHMRKKPVLKTRFLEWSTWSTTASTTSTWSYAGMPHVHCCSTRCSTNKWKKEIKRNEKERATDGMKEAKRKRISASYALCVFCIVLALTHLHNRLRV